MIPFGLFVFFNVIEVAHDAILAMPDFYYIVLLSVVSFRRMRGESFISSFNLNFCLMHWKYNWTHFTV